MGAQDRVLDLEKDDENEVQLAFADEGARRPSPFGPPAGETPKPDVRPEPEGPAARPGDPVGRPGDPAARPAERAGAPEFMKKLPAEALSANQRAFEALQTVRSGVALNEQQKAAFESALAAARKVEPPAWLQEQQSKLVDDLQNRSRTLPNGAVLPPWTTEKEKQFVDRLLSSQKAFEDMSADAKKKVGEIEANLSKLAANDTIRRGVFQRMLEDEGQRDPKVKSYIAEKGQLDRFTKDNAEGLVRRNMHQQEMSVLHSRAVVSGLYAIALDRAGQPADQKKLEELLKDSVKDLFAPANIPELVGLTEKYKLEEKENQALEDKVPGRADLRKAMEIMNDEKIGSAAARLEKARPFFEKAIGASALIDQQKTAEEIEKISKERNALGDKIGNEKLNELETRATELVEKARLAYEVRLRFATALQNAAVEKKDKDLNAQAIAVLKAAESLDPAYKLDPVIQGALHIAQKEPMESFDLKKAEEVGKPITDQIKADLIKQGKMADDRPMWQKALWYGGEALLGVAAFHLIGKYVFGPMLAAKNYIKRSWELSSRLGNVQTEATPSLKAGEQPKLVLKTRDGKEMAVEGVRYEDGKIRVWNGEKTEAHKLRSGDTLVMKLPPDANLSKEQVKDLASKKLTPIAEEEVINEVRTRYEEEIKIRDRANEALKQANEELQRKVEAGGPGTKPPGTTDGSSRSNPDAARPERVVPTAGKLQGTDTRMNPDGSLERREALPGEVLAREQLERRDRVDQKEIDVMKRSAEELAKSEKAADKEKAEALRKTVDALEGRLGVEAQAEAHKSMLAESKKALERGEGGGYGRAVVGGLIGLGILTAAALAYYNSTNAAQERRALERARVK